MDSELKEKHNLDNIERLADLLSKGILTQNEFEIKKKQILDL